MADPKTIEDFEKLEYPAVIIPGEDSGYVVVYPDLPGVVAHGETKAEALERAEELRLAWTERRLELGWPVPLPGELESCNGKLNIRIPRSVHRSLKLRAKHEGVSLNQLTASILAKSL